MPKITKNLINISKSDLYNHAFVEFTNDFYFVKGRETKLGLFHRVVKERLYQLVIITLSVQSFGQSSIPSSFQKHMFHKFVN